MKDREEWFEMAPPTMFSVRGGEFMTSGKEKRHEDVMPATCERILKYCREALTGASYPASRFYGDLALDTERHADRSARRARNPE
jgi:hypothetical protein